MSEGVLARLRALLGDSGVAAGIDGTPRAMPESTEDVAEVMQLAHAEGWKVRVEGQATWLGPDAPAQLALSTRALNRVVSVSPEDLVATAQAGAPLDVLRRHLGEAGMWLPVDPPGRPERSLGSVLATATAGPLRLGFGFIRDQVVGLTVVTGDGKIVSTGGRVVKNVAGYDLAKLEIGGFGGFGIITEVNLRLRAVPRADLTMVASGSRDDLSAAARDIRDAGIGCASLELVSPTLAAEPEWMLAARLTGTDGAVEADARRVSAVAPRDWTALASDRSSALWALIARGPVGPPVTLRLGVLPEGVDEMLDAVTRDLDEGLISAGPAGGGLRLAGDIDAERLRTMRRMLAAREIPLTLERAPWELRREVGHFGAYREGVGALVSKLREVFDPGEQLSVALEAET